jgi:hypothetical protein
MLMMLLSAVGGADQKHMNPVTQPDSHGQLITVQSSLCVLMAVKTRLKAHQGAIVCHSQGGQARQNGAVGGRLSAWVRLRGDLSSAKSFCTKGQ